MSKLSLGVQKAAAVRPDAVLVQAPEIVIPETRDELTVSMNALGGGIMLAGWATAATVYAWTEPGTGGPRTVRKTGQLTLREFAELGIRGLSRTETVSAYRSRWDDAIHEGWAKPVARGDVVTLPSQDFRDGDKWEPGAGLMSSLTPEWYTPREVIERVVAVMGAIDLDPCSNERGEPRVPATQHFTAVDDGLSQPWRGRIYMNPPYGKEIGAWVDKLAEEFEYGNVTEAIALVPARTDTSWWAHLPAGMVCFATGRLTFSDHPTPAPFPSAVCYLGSRQREFAEQFLSLGLVYVRLETEAVA